MDYSQIIFEQYLINTGLVFTSGMVVGLLCSVLTLHVCSRLANPYRRRMRRGQAYEVKF